ncbi:MAG: hypothetical protein WC091_07340 [Sulfuricellaceae bacterium]
MNIVDLRVDKFDMTTEVGRAEAQAKIEEFEKEIALTNAAIAELEKAIELRR